MHIRHGRYLWSEVTELDFSMQFFWIAQLQEVSVHRILHEWLILVEIVWNLLDLMVNTCQPKEFNWVDFQIQGKTFHKYEKWKLMKTTFLLMHIPKQVGKNILDL